MGTHLTTLEEQCMVCTCFTDNDGKPHGPIFGGQWGLGCEDLNILAPNMTPVAGWLMIK